MRLRSTLRPLTPILLCALPGLAAGLQKGTDELARERELFQSNKEEDCRAATDGCVAKNSIPAVELLFEVLGLESDRGNYLPSAHYRDIVWDGLLRISDRYARGRIEQELLKNKKSAWLRQWCAELLGEYGDAAYGPGLLEALHDKDLGVKRAIVDPDLDTVFLLSTGEPEIGTYVHWNRVTWQLQELNRFQKVVIHTIAYSADEGYRGQLQKIAEATGGEFVWFE